MWELPVDGHAKPGELQPRDWSPFISHIRFCLIITFAWGWWLIRYFKNREPIALIVVGLITVFGGWFTWKVASLTGAILFPLTLLVASWQFQRMRKAVLGLCGAGAIAAGVVAWCLLPVYPEADALKLQRLEAKPTSTTLNGACAKMEPTCGFISHGMNSLKRGRRAVPQTSTVRTEETKSSK